MVLWGLRVDDNMVMPQVMIVDDALCIRVMVEELLANEGIRACCAPDAEACLAHLRSGFRGLILMDVMMPDKDGWQAIREIEQAGLLPGNIVVMLTALDEPDERMNGLQSLVVDYITKPFKPEMFIETVRKYLGYLAHVAVTGD